MTDEFDPLKEALRDSLHRHAADAPRGDMLADRIINTAQHAPPLDPHRTRRGWRTWTLPLIAAGAVAAVVGAVVGIENLRPEASHKISPATQGLSNPAPTQIQSTQPTEPTTTTASNAPGTLTGFKITDLTFVGDNDGWALGSADCLTGAGRCTAMWRTTDGHSWTSMAGAEFNVPNDRGMCAEPCVHNIRFATDDVGYAFGPSAFFMTDDGGKSWQQQDGGALQLETLDNNVIRVTGKASGCPGPCVDGIETSAVGSSNWTLAEFRYEARSVAGVQLSRGSGGGAYLLVTGNPAGGADARSTLYRSTDNGESWTNVGEPCPQGPREVDSSSVAGSPDGRVSVLCTVRDVGGRSFVAVSTDAGTNFNARSGTIPSTTNGLLTGDPDTVLVAGGVGMARSTDGGATWQTVADVPGEVGWVGFESQTVGRAVSADGSTIWTTRDGGATWHPASIG